MIVNNRQRENGTTETEIDLLALLSLLWKRKWIIVIAALVLAGAGYLYSRFYLVPTYRTSFTAFINNRAESNISADYVNGSDLSTSRTLTYTYAEIIRSDSVLERAAEKVGIVAAIDTLRSFVSTNIGDNTQLVYVYVTMNSPSLAAQFANSIAAVSSEYMSEVVEGSSMKIVVDAKVPLGRYFPSYTRYALIGALIGIVGSAAVIILVDLLDRRVKSEEDLSDNYGIPVIGSIPDLKVIMKGGSARYGYGYGENPEEVDKSQDVSKQ